MLSRYLSDPQRHEKIGCSISTVNAKNSPAQDIKETKKKIRAILPKEYGGGANQREGH
jgi:hypothetical protein